MTIKIRNANSLVLAVNNQPADSSHRARKAIVSGEIVHISVYTGVYKTVYRHAVKPTPHPDEFADDGVGAESGHATYPTYLRMLG